MRKDQIVVGKSYVNEQASIIREVVEEVDRRHVRANTFDLVTGKLVPTRHKTWRRSQLAVWADREADPGEAARVHPYETGGSLEGLLQPEYAGTPVDQAKATLDAAPAYSRSLVRNSLQ